MGLETQMRGLHDEEEHMKNLSSPITDARQLSQEKQEAKRWIQHEPLSETLTK